MSQASTRGQVLARARVQVLQNSGGRIVLLRLQLCQREIDTDEIQENKNFREQSNIKSARVRALTAR